MTGVQVDQGLTWPRYSAPTISTEGNGGIAVGYGHAQDLAGKAVEHTVAGESDPPPVDPGLWWREDVRAALRGRDIGAVYRVVLEATGMSQHRLATVVGQAQSLFARMV